MPFINQVEKLCYEHGESLTELTKAVGMASSSISKWKRGAIPRHSSLKLIADHFGVTVDYLLSDEKAAPTIWESRKETSEYGTLSSQEKQLIDMYRELTEIGKMRLIQAVLNVYDREKDQ